MGQEEFQALVQRVGRLKTAIALGQPDRVPVAPFFDGVIGRFTGRTYRDVFYDFERAGQSAIEFLHRYPNVDAASVPQFTSGLANELAGTRMIDWPGEPGTRIADTSTHQVNEIVFMEQEEYPELLRDYTGFILRKYIPRAFTNLQGTANIRFDVPSMMNSSMLTPLGSEELQKTMAILARIGEEEGKATQATIKYSGVMAGLGYPGMITSASEAPYDILGDYFRGTMGMFGDLLDEKTVGYMEQVVDMFADMQIARLQYLRFMDLPFKTCFFPLHKGMDGFMNDKQFERLYWQPLKRIILALIDMDVLPYIYTEGPYNTRLDFLTDVPKGKVLYHFEKVDMKRAKETVGKVACISGNLSVANLEFGKKEQIVAQTRALIETCAPGGGYIFDFDGSLENANPENLDAMFETLELCGKY